MSKKFTVGQKIWFMDTMPLKLKQHTVVKVLENGDIYTNPGRGRSNSYWPEVSIWILFKTPTAATNDHIRQLEREIKNNQKDISKLIKMRGAEK